MTPCATIQLRYHSVPLLFSSATIPFRDHSVLGCRDGWDAGMVGIGERSGFKEGWDAGREGWDKGNIELKGVEMKGELGLKKG